MRKVMILLLELLSTISGVALVTYSVVGESPLRFAVGVALFGLGALIEERNEWWLCAPLGRKEDNHVG